MLCAITTIMSIVHMIDSGYVQHYFILLEVLARGFVLEDYTII